jgi:hypothetical protein
MNDKLIIHPLETKTNELHIFVLSYLSKIKVKKIDFRPLLYYFYGINKTLN